MGKSMDYFFSKGAWIFLDVNLFFFIYLFIIIIIIIEYLRDLNLLLLLV